MYQNFKESEIVTSFPMCMNQLQTHSFFTRINCTLNISCIVSHLASQGVFRPVKKPLGVQNVDMPTEKKVTTKVVNSHGKKDLDLHSSQIPSRTDWSASKSGKKFSKKERSRNKLYKVAI